MPMDWLRRLWERLKGQVGPAPGDSSRGELATVAGRVSRLSRRQREVAGLALDGLTNRQIASQLGISEETVKKHINIILRTLGIHSRIELDQPDIRRFLRGPP